MTDRELLELAARAAGMSIQRNRLDDPLCDDFLMKGSSPRNKGQFAFPWNPLTDDGDALRLSVTLELNVFHAAGCAYAMPSEDDGRNEHRVSYVDAGGKYQATRLAIVRAAAEIGRAMP